MRPRPDATENVRVVASVGRHLGGFNEAAARCHGKLTGRADGLLWYNALQ